MRTPLSIIVPVYNVARFLRDLVDSLAANRGVGHEIIFVDDCGTDESWEVLGQLVGRLQHASVKLIRHERNSGLSVARNTGLKAASGDYVYFLDSDDMLQEAAIDRIIIAADKKRSDVLLLDFDFCKTAVEYRCRRLDNELHDSAKARGFPPHPYHKQERLDVWEGSRRFRHLKGLDHEAIFDDFIRRTTFYAWSFVYRRDLVSNLSYVAGKYFEDVQFTLQAALAAKSFGLIACEPLHLYRQREGSIMSAMNPRKIKDLTDAVAPVYEAPVWQGIPDGRIRDTVLAIELQYHVWAVNDYLHLQLPAPELESELEVSIKTIRQRIAGRKSKILKLFSACRPTRDALHARIIVDAPISTVFALARRTNSIQRSQLWQFWRRVRG